MAHLVVVIAGGRCRWPWPVTSVRRDIHARIEIPIRIGFGAVSDKWEPSGGRQAQHEGKSGEYALHGPLFFLPKEAAISDVRIGIARKTSPDGRFTEKAGNRDLSLCRG
jgi:hypothetical protein